VFAAPACEPGQDGTMTCFSASSPFSSGSAAVVHSALARCHGSRLLTHRSLFVHRSAVSFLTSPTFRRFSRVLPRPRVLPGAFAHFVPPFGVFHLADRFYGRQSQSPVLIHSSNLYPLGNCVSLRPETNLSYLTRLGTASYRSSSLSPFFAFTDDARTPPEELVNPASHRFLRFDFEGLSQPA
jgi:hypothetical protein